MTTIFQLVAILNALFFLFYGFQSLNSHILIEEFKRFGMTDKMRQLTGILQIIGSAGLLAGLYYTVIGLLAAGGLTAMMFIAFIVRLKIKDSLAQLLPSFIFMLVNAWLTIAFYNFL